MAERLFLDIARVEIPDHRGKGQVVAFMDLIGSPRGYASTPPREVLRAIRRRMVQRSWAVGLVLGSMMIVAICAVFTILLLKFGTRPGVFYGACLLSLAPLAILYELTALKIFRRVYRTVFPEAVLAQGFCPHCLYDLRGVAAREGDGCTICPECAGAWKMPGAEATGVRPPDA